MPKDENYFITFHRGCGGLTADRFKHVNQKYNVLSDLYRNAFALQVKDDGSIGYKYLIQDCDSEEQAYTINSGFSKPDIIPDNEWVTVHVVLKPIGIVYGKETVATSFSQKMVLYIYVDGKLVYVSDEIPTLNLKELNDLADKQEGVPFNISVGGGTQGLSDVIYEDFKKLPDKRLPLEKEFGGSFIGYFKSFKAYSCALSLSEIRNNVIFENAFRLNNTIY
jgi:curved DNA-binding protein CbpA